MQKSSCLNFAHVELMLRIVLSTCDRDNMLEWREAKWPFSFWLFESFAMNKNSQYTYLLKEKVGNTFFEETSYFGSFSVCFDSVWYWFKQTRTLTQFHRPRDVNSVWKHKIIRLKRGGGGVSGASVWCEVMRWCNFAEHHHSSRKHQTSDRPLGLSKSAILVLVNF